MPQVHEFKSSDVYDITDDESDYDGLELSTYSRDVVYDESGEEMETDQEFINRLKGEFNENQLILFEAFFEDEDLLDEENVDELIDLIVALENSVTMVFSQAVQFALDILIPVFVNRSLKFLIPAFKPVKFVSMTDIVRRFEAKRQYFKERKQQMKVEWQRTRQKMIQDM
jgi:hypothetical protein